MKFRPIDSTNVRPSRLCGSAVEMRLGEVATSGIRSFHLFYLLDFSTATKLVYTRLELRNQNFIIAFYVLTIKIGSCAYDCGYYHLLLSLLFIYRILFISLLVEKIRIRFPKT